MKLIDAALHPCEAGRKAYRRVRAALLERGWGDGFFWSGMGSELALDAGRRRAWGEEAAALERELQARWAEVGGGWSRGGLLEAECRRVLYLLVRALEPERVVETGVANGGSSFFILSALAKNGKGKLWSFEPPERSPFVPPGRGEGWLVPEGLRGSWTLLRENSLTGLEPLFARLGPVDLFFHDSDHSYEVMDAEYRLAWPHVRPGGVLASDDVFFHSAFDDFAARAGGRPLVWRTRLGILRKAA